ncbi:MAG: UDP-N-acetylmuramoyl-L-alanyl-D-glutamate--2,6-diaminopimelate ligase [Candidatus Omnitrophica bacterium]|nr:UDP-N-acetylmuramoyl-L-alanyl-D-glutamate--2,6-diaminopimelate ligase [Candidatus Omnitrophota bacterium]
MRFKDLIKKLSLNNNHIQDFFVKGISCNSKDVSDKFIFVAIKGNSCNGHHFVGEAIAKGAKAVFVQSSSENYPLKERINLIKVKDTRKVLADLTRYFYKDPSAKIKVVGITGTNGKTTTSYIIEAILKEAGFNPGVLGTISYRYKNKVIPSKNTTPGPIELQSLLKEMVDKGVDYVIIEVSSHALDQERTRGIGFSYGIFTNLTQDHLDYHKNITSYFKAKSKLFKELSSRSLAIINNDDVYGRRLKMITPARLFSYGIDNQSDILAKDIKYDLSHTEFNLITKDFKVRLKSGLIGRHNVYNILAGISFALNERIDFEIVRKVIEEFCSVPGRLERINSEKGFSVFVDYAHTEDALRNVIETLRPLVEKRIIVVFGCGGQRDKTKRPRMGRVVTELADYAVITSDNPRSENPRAIIEDIKKGIRKRNYCVIPDRFEAIKKALTLAKQGDIVVVAGKGHENYQILKDKVIPFNDSQVIKRCLNLKNS